MIPSPFSVKQLSIADGGMEEREMLFVWLSRRMLEISLFTFPVCEI